MGTTFSDTVYLQTQSRGISGTVVSVTEREVILKTEDGLLLPLNRGSVERIIFGAERVDPGGRQSIIEPMPPLPDAPPTPAASTEEIPVSNTMRQVYPLPGNVQEVDLEFPNTLGSFSEDTFVALSRFKGLNSNRMYAGLYHFEDRGTFWIRLPYVQAATGELRFTLYGKKNTNQPVEKYEVKANFLNEQGHVLSQSKVAVFDASHVPVVEWFQHLQDISGLAGKVEVAWSVPPGTKTVELQAISLDDPSRHLLGYLGDLVLTARWVNSADRDTSVSENTK